MENKNKNKNKPEFLLIRYNMKVLLTNFDKAVKRECQGATRDNEELIKKRLSGIAEKFGEEYDKLQSQYMKCLFLEDLSEIAGGKTAELCLGFMEKESNKSDQIV